MDVAQALELSIFAVVDLRSDSLCRLYIFISYYDRVAIDILIVSKP